MTICPKCGLPKEICACEALVKESQKIKIWIEKRKWGRPVTLVEGLKPEDFDPEAWKGLIKKLKTKLACGATYDKDNKLLEFQGNQMAAIKPLLRSSGFKLEDDKVSNGSELRTNGS